MSAPEVLHVPRAVLIRTADGQTVIEFASASDWRDLKHARCTAARIDLRAMLAEEYHRAYGRPWVLGRCYFDELMAPQVRPSDRVLDLGCGAGRVGIWLIPFLDIGH